MCLQHGIDFIPSPYRMYDCFATSCENGSTIHQMSDLLSRTNNNITDINASPRRYGLPCPTKDPMRRSGSIMMRKLHDAFDIKQAIMKWGPLPAAVDFNDEAEEKRHWIFHPATKPRPTHSVVIIGWGSTPENYWLIQNSWGRHWGANGRGMLAERALRYAAVEMDQTYILQFIALWILIPLFTVAILIQIRKVEEDEDNA